MSIFRDLTPLEIADFERWANNNYTPHTEIKGIWHPVVQARCAAINTEYDPHDAMAHGFRWDCGYSKSDMARDNKDPHDIYS